METDNEESVRLSPEAYLQKAQEMLADPEFSPTAKERSKLILALKFLPLLTGIGNNVIGIGSAIAQLIAIEKSISNALRATSHTIADSFQYAGIAFAALDFIRIPALYLSSWMLGEKSPVTLSKNARWLYAGILLGLAITALAVPAAAAPIALLTGVMGLGVSIFSMAWFFQRRQEVRQELNKINKAIKGENAKLKTLQEQAKEYESKLQEAIKAKNKEVIQEYTAKIEKLHQAFASQKEKLQNLHERKEKYEKKKLKRGMGGLADKTVGVGLSALALIGLVTYLYFPPAGLGILLAGAAIGTLYIVARVTYPLIKNFAAWIREKISAPTSKEEGVQQENEVAPQLNVVHESQATVLNQLAQKSDNPKKGNSQTAENQSAEKTKTATEPKKSGAALSYSSPWYSFFSFNLARGKAPSVKPPKINNPKT